MEASQASTAPSGDPLIGQTLDGRYTVGRRIGEGGMGIVYEAQHAIIGKRVALKVLRRDYSSRPDVVERFKQEAQSASRVDSPHIIDISDFGETPEGDSYFVMEFLEGEDLSNRIREGESLDGELALRIAIQCCDALGAAHAAHIVHRDMKPENIFLTPRRGDPTFVKIVDFGIAKMNDVSADAPTMKKLTKTGMIFGTPEYMSPEQAAGKPMDYRVDIYAMGVILYEMFAGTVPFLGDTFMGVLTQHMFDSPPSMKESNPNAEFPPGVEPIILRCMQKDPDERYQSMDELAEALRACRNPEAEMVVSGDTQMGWAGSPSSAPPRVPRMLSPEDARASEFPAIDTRSKVPMMILALLLGGSVLAAGVWFWTQRSHTSAIEQNIDGALAAPSDEVTSEPEPADRGGQPSDDATEFAIAQGVSAETVEEAYPLTIEYDGYRSAAIWIDGVKRTDCTSSPCVVSLKNKIYDVALVAGGKQRRQKTVVVDGAARSVELSRSSSQSGADKSLATKTTESKDPESKDKAGSSDLSAEELAALKKRQDEMARKQREMEEKLNQKNYGLGGKDLMDVRLDDPKPE